MSDTVLAEIAALFAAGAARIHSVRSAFDHEPDFSQQLDLPAVTLQWVGLGQDDVELGTTTENTWTWDVRIYVPLEQGWGAAQRSLETITMHVLTLIRSNMTMDGLVDRLSVADGGPPEIVRDQGYIYKPLRLTAQTTEL